MTTQQRDRFRDFLDSPAYDPDGPIEDVIAEAERIGMDLEDAVLLLRERGAEKKHEAEDLESLAHQRARH